MGATDTTNQTDALNAQLQAQTTTGYAQSGYNPGTTKVCPTCGKCPTCGRHRVNPYQTWPRQYPYYYQYPYTQYPGTPQTFC